MKKLLISSEALKKKDLYILKKIKKKRWSLNNYPLLKY